MPVLLICWLWSAFVCVEMKGYTNKIYSLYGWTVNNCATSISGSAADRRADPPLGEDDAWFYPTVL